MSNIECYESGIDYTNSGDIVADAKLIIDSAQRVAHQAVNITLIRRNWLLGRRIVEEELGDGTRSELYGRKVVSKLAEELTREYGKGYTRRSLYQYAQFYRMFPEIVQMSPAQSIPRLSWSHYVELLRVKNDRARAWYEQEAAGQGWSVEVLSRNISSQYCERMLSNQVEPPHEKAAVPSAEAERAERLAFVKSPMVVEFLGLSDNPRLHESSLESAILANLQQFLLELGKGYAFVARQQHIRTEWDDFFIDLVFYNYILRCFVLVDLKTNKITHQDVGQMDMYVRMYDDLKRNEGDNPTLGIVLCAETDEDIARYSVLHENEQLFSSKYKLYLPDEEELRAEIEEQKRIFRAQVEEDGDIKGSH
ncbi:MAG: PDDEXK nuclease domain-containing protein [Coriobacteriales bacterium]|jgi:predicted nuclease of restriction endonuclease-like (RecB) superfamily